MVSGLIMAESTIGSLFMKMMIVPPSFRYLAKVARVSRSPVSGRSSVWYIESVPFSNRSSTADWMPVIPAE